MDNERPLRTPPFFFDHASPLSQELRCDAKVEEWAAKFAKLQTENVHWRFAAHSVALWSPLPPVIDLTPGEFMSRMADAILNLLDRARDAEKREADTLDLLRRVRAEVIGPGHVLDASRDAVLDWALKFVNGPAVCGICGKPTDETAQPGTTLPNEPDPQTTFAHEACLLAKRREAFLGLSPEVKSRLAK